MAKHKKAKAVAYELIPRQSDRGRPMYTKLDDVVAQHHEALERACARIALAWAKAWKPDVDGRLVLGKMKKASDLDREFAPFDFVILLNKDFWNDTRVTDAQRLALLDHELCHGAVAHDTDGEPIVDERGRNRFRIRKHDIEEFREIVDRHGCYKEDLVAFYAALRKAQGRVAETFIGPTRLSNLLERVGILIDRDTIAAWPSAERKGVELWLATHEALGEDPRVNLSLSSSKPAVIAAALGEPAPADPPTAH